MKECKKHKWRVGSGIAELVGKKLIKTKLNIWCEKCNKVIKAGYFPSYELKAMKENAINSKNEKGMKQ